MSVTDPDVLVGLAEVVHGPTTRDEKVAWVVDAARRLVDAPHVAFLALAGGEPNELWRVSGAARFDGLHGAVLAELADDVIRGGSPRRIRPSVRLAQRATGPTEPFSELLAAPVPSDGGRAHGALVVGREDAGAFADGHLDVLRVLGRHLGVALDSAARVERLEELEALQRHVAHQLQDAVRPTVVDVEGAELGVWYVGADAHAPTGGDLYDWLALPDGDVHLTVVDVLGKGVEATRDALAVVHALRVLVSDGSGCGELVARADALLAQQHDELVATLLVARYRPSDGVLTVAGGGHPPLLVVSRDGRARYVDAPGVPIGWPGAGSDAEVTVPLEPGDAAVLYTDGLLESTKDVVEGMARLEAAAEALARYPTAHLARALVERALTGAVRQDDSLAVVLRRRTQPARPAAPVLAPFEYRFTPNAAAVSLVRRAARDWFAHQPVDDDDAADLTLVVAELAANAVRAASGAPGSAAIRARVDGDAVVVEAEDDGPGFALPSWAPEELPPGDAETGRGLFVVDALSDQVEAVVEGGRCVVRAVRRGVVGEQGRGGSNSRRAD